MNGIGGGGVDLDEIRQRVRGLGRPAGLWVEEVHHQIAKFDAHHGGEKADVVILNSRVT